jgi:hypothetical protein
MPVGLSAALNLPLVAAVLRIGLIALLALLDINIALLLAVAGVVGLALSLGG